MSKQSTLSEVAARWYLRMREHSQEPQDVEIKAFETWLADDPRHAIEYESIAGAMRQLDSTDGLSKLAAAAEQQAFMANESKRKSRQSRIAQLLMLCFITVLGYLGQQHYQVWQATPVMQLAAQNTVGQIVTKTLDDGSKIILSANSNMEIVYYRRQRHVHLKKGEAVFEVIKDPDRPFVVETDTTKVTVLGTRFAVNRLENLVRVSVDHGSVKVEPKFVSNTERLPESNNARVITNGQVVEVYPNHVPVLVNRPASDAFSFLNGRLVFDKADANEIAYTVSRYRHKPVAALGKQARNISADINIQDINEFLQGLPNIAPVKVQESPELTSIKSN